MDAFGTFTFVWPWAKARFETWFHRFLSSRKRQQPMTEVVDQDTIGTMSVVDSLSLTQPVVEVNCNPVPVIESSPGIIESEAVTPSNDQPGPDSSTETAALDLDNGTAAILAAQVQAAGGDSKDAAMLQPTLDAHQLKLTATGVSITGTVTTADPKPSIPLQVANLDASADLLFAALDALVAKLAPVLGKSPDADGTGDVSNKGAPLAGQLAAVNAKLAHVLALINATTAAVDL